MWRATYFSSLRTRLNLAPLGMPKRVWPSMNRSKIFFIQTSTLPPSMHHKLTDTWKVLYAKQPNPDQKVMLSYRTTLIWYQFYQPDGRCQFACISFILAILMNIHAYFTWASKCNCIHQDKGHHWILFWPRKMCATVMCDLRRWYKLVL